MLLGACLSGVALLVARRAPHEVLTSIEAERDLGWLNEDAVDVVIVGPIQLRAVQLRASHEHMNDVAEVGEAGGANVIHETDPCCGHFAQAPSRECSTVPSSNFTLCTQTFIFVLSGLTTGYLSFFVSPGFAWRSIAIQHPRMG